MNYRDTIPPRIRASHEIRALRMIAHIAFRQQNDQRIIQNKFWMFLNRLIIFWILHEKKWDYHDN